MKIILKAQDGKGELTLENKEIKGDPQKPLGFPEIVASVSIGNTAVLVDIDELIRASKALQPSDFETFVG